MTTIPLARLRVEVAEGELCLTRAAGLAKVSPAALRQLCAIAGVPLGYCRRISPTMQASNLNHGLAARANGHRGFVSLRINGDVLESLYLE